MRKYIVILAAVILLLFPATVLAASFGIGPPSIELEVPADGSTIATFYITSDFEGELQVSLENIPLRVEPATIPITKTDSSCKVELTFYGNESLNTQVYDGYVRFLALTEGNIATGIKVKAKVTNVVEEQSVTIPTEELEETSAPAATVANSSKLAWYMYILIGLATVGIVTTVKIIRRRIGN